MRYISTRGGIAPLSFKEAVMMGLADDGGLILPESIPQVEELTVESWRNLPYQYLAVQILGLFIDDIPQKDLEILVENSYARFSHPQVTPTRKIDDFYILELFHGPTLAFKDVALQLLGNIFEYLLKENGSFMNILGATSGDTGSAAIYGVRGKDRINIFILHPDGRVSPVQEKQMTTVLDENVFNIAIKGTFDDGQSIVKSIFNDLDFKGKYHLASINSINWARVLAQVVYYVFTFLKFRKQGIPSVDFSIPTGNFGDIFAGYVAKRLLPKGNINRLILATNSNDILTRFVQQGDYSKGKVVSSSSPSMDIQVASNFERYLYYLRGEDGIQVKSDMEAFAKTGSLDLSQLTPQIAKDFTSVSVDEEQTIATIKNFHSQYGYILDPHTAVGVKAGIDTKNEARPMICLATAHPAKFGDSVNRAIGKEPERPSALQGLEELKSRMVTMDAKTNLIKEYIQKHALT